MSALGLIGKNDSGQNLLNTLTSIGVPKVNAINVIRTAINVCIRSTYYLFCKKDKDWLDPDLLVFKRTCRHDVRLWTLTAVKCILSCPFWRVAYTRFLSCIKYFMQLVTFRDDMFSLLLLL